MKTVWEIPKNYETGLRFRMKNEAERGTQRITILLTKQQRRVLDSYCEENSTNYGELLRKLLGEYFERENFDLPADQPEDTNQMKLFNE